MNNDYFIPSFEYFNFPEYLSMVDLLVYSALMRRMNEGRLAVADVNELRLLTRTTAKTVRSHIERLIRANLIKHCGYDINRRKLYVVADAESLYAKESVQ